MRALTLWLIVVLPLAGCAARDRLPEGYLGTREAQAVLDKTLRLHLAPDLAALSDGERRALAKLIEAGPIFQRLYELQRHEEALAAHAALIDLHEAGTDTARTRRLLDLYRLFQGPIMTTLENDRMPFLPVAEERPGKNLYPLDADAEALSTYVDANPEALGVRNVVRAATADAFAADLAVLDRYPEIAELHPDLRVDLEQIRDDGEEAFYVVPYSVAYADEVVEASRLLAEAGEAVASSDPEFAEFLRVRARDLLDDDYEEGDAAWITGDFVNLNAQIGAYETYADALFGVKSQFGLSLLLRDRPRSDALAAVTKDIQRLEDALPYESRKRVREGIPIGVYNVIADWGDPRGTNTATILPNEAHIANRYGRTILLRTNIMTNPAIFAESAKRFRAAVHAGHADDLTQDGEFAYTVWHEIGHYLGPEETRNGRSIDASLLDTSDLLEEMKADLIGLFTGRMLLEAGYYDETSLRGLYASGVDRVLLKTKPRRDQPYGTMQLMQLNYFLEHGLLEWDEEHRLRVRYDRFHDVVSDLLREVLELQVSGDKQAADRFIERHTTWSEDAHEVLAHRLRQAEGSRFSLVTYGVLGE